MQYAYILIALRMQYCDNGSPIKTRAVDMNVEKKNNEVESMHLSYIGGLLTESIRSFHNDMLTNCRFSSEIFCRASFVRMMELKDRFDQAALITNQSAFFRS
jgi:hypothetical protein